MPRSCSEHGHLPGSSNTLLPCRAGAFIRAVEGNLLAAGRVRCRAGAVGSWRLGAGHGSAQPPGGRLAGPGAGEEITARDKCHLAHGCVGSREPGMERVGSPGAVQAGGAPPALGGLAGHRAGPRCQGIRCPPAGAELIASMQFELISCFRWNSANQCRKEAETGAIKLTSQSWL